MTRRRGLAALGLAAILVGACVSTPTTPGPSTGSPPASSLGPSSPPPTASPSPTPSAVLPTAPATPSPSPTPSATPPTLAQLIGQKLIVRMEGTTPTSALLGRIRRGEVGGVIIFGANVTTAPAMTALTAKLQAAARSGGQPPLLIAVDQEGGSIRRLPWAPPTLSPPQIGATGSAATAHVQGAATAAGLLAVGVNVDLAPVADVPGPGSFMAAMGRTFSADPAVTASLADAFAAGLESGGVIPAMKHFPGLGLATGNTDDVVVTIDASAAALDPGLDAYRTAIGHGLPLVMLANATYLAYDGSAAAGWSSAIGSSLLRGQLGFAGVTMTDSLDGTAHARGVTEASLALRAASAGTDLLLLTGSESTTAGAYAALLAAARAGTIPPATLAASYARILQLKASLGSP